MKIPIENIFFLLCYAWDSLGQRELVDHRGLKGDRVNDLLATVLVTGLTMLLRHGLERHYNLNKCEIPGIRGKLDLSDTVKEGSLLKARTVCTFFEFTADTPANRILKATVRSLLQDKNLDRALHDNLATLYRGLRPIQEERLKRQSFRHIQFHRNNRLYRFLISICRLWLERSFVDEQSGEVRFRDFERDEKQMRLLFEKFVRNFYRHQLNNQRVRARITKWVARSEDAESLALLPELKTDICIPADGKLLVIDTKYTRSTRSYHETEKLREAHLYQLFAYLMNLSQDKRFQGQLISGMLLYPVTDDTSDVSVTIHGFPVSIRHLNLAQPWENITEQLLSIHDEAMSAMTA